VHRKRNTIGDVLFARGGVDECAVGNLQTPVENHIAGDLAEREALEAERKNFVGANHWNLVTERLELIRLETRWLGRFDDRPRRACVNDQAVGIDGAHRNLQWLSDGDWGPNGGGACYWRGRPLVTRRNTLGPEASITFINESIWQGVRVLGRRSRQSLLAGHSNGVEKSPVLAGLGLCLPV